MNAPLLKGTKHTSRKKSFYYCVQENVEICNEQQRQDENHQVGMHAYSKTYTHNITVDISYNKLPRSHILKYISKS